MSSVAQRRKKPSEGYKSGIVKSIVTADTRGRLTLGAISKGKSFRVSLNEKGQIVLDPVKAVPEREAWLWENEQALHSVKKGIEEAARGETRSLGSFAGFADIEIGDD